MENIDYTYLCNVIGNLTGIPIRLYKGNQPILYHAIVHLPKDPLGCPKTSSRSSTHFVKQEKR